MRYLLFTYDSYYPCGASNDFVDKYDNLDDVHNTFKKDEYEFADIFDTSTWECSRLHKDGDELVLSSTPTPEGIQKFKDYPLQQCMVRGIGNHVDITDFDVDYSLGRLYYISPIIITLLAQDGTRLAYIEIATFDKWRQIITCTLVIDDERHAMSRPKFSLRDNTILTWDDKTFTLKAKATIYETHDYHWHAWFNKR